MKSEKKQPKRCPHHPKAVVHDEPNCPCCKMAKEIRGWLSVKEFQLTKTIRAGRK